MTPEAFVALAGGLAMVKTKAVMGAVRLAVGGKTFATVGWPQPGWAVVKLTPADQKHLMALTDALEPERGRRGGRGVTLVRLHGLGEVVAGRIALAAWRCAQGQGDAITAKAS